MSGFVTTMWQIWTNHVEWESHHQPMCDELKYLCTYTIVYTRTKAMQEKKPMPSMDWLY